MASEKVYVGKAGAQELYKRVEEHIDARIPKVPGAKGNMGKFTEDGSLEDAGVSAAALESAVRDDHTHANKDILDATTAAYTTEEQAKLSGIAEDAQVNVIETITIDGEPLTPTEKAVNIPDAGTSTKGVVKLTSDIESVDVNAAITAAAVKDALRHVSGYKVADRGQDGKPDVPLADRSPNYIYLTEVPNTPEPDHYEEWIWSPGDQSVEAKWVLIGTTTVDLTDYVERVDDAVEGNLASLTAGGYMADSGISGSGVADAVNAKHSHNNKATLDLVEEPYTTAEQTKLAGMEDFVESFIAPDYDPNKTVYYQGELCIYEDKCYRAKNIIMNSGSAIGAFDSTKWAETNFADSRLQILNWYVMGEGAPSNEVTKKAIESGALVGLRYITPGSSVNYQKRNAIFWLESYDTDNAGNVSAKFVNAATTLYAEPEYASYNNITYNVKTYSSSDEPHWTEESFYSPFYTSDDQSKLQGIAPGAQVNKIESISVNNVAVTPVNKNVNIVIPKAVPDPSAQNQMLFSTDGATWAPMTWEMEYFDALVIGGKAYRTVTIGTQEWMAENLDFRFDYNGSPLPLNNSGTSNSPAAYYYNYDNIGTYVHGGSYNTGLLYNWHAVDYLNTNRNTLCPGWHVPSDDDFNKLFRAVGGNSSAGTKLKYDQPGWAPSWRGDDTYEFSATPSGIYTGNFANLSTELRLWSSTVSYEVSTYALYAYFTTGNSTAMQSVYKYYGMSVRLVKDSV